MDLSKRIIDKSRRARNRVRLLALLLLTYLWRRLMFRTTVIAITGSIGKTTAKECLAAVLELHGRTLKTFQNQNDRYGVPPTIRSMRPWHRFAVIELGAHGPGTIRSLARLVRPDIAIILRVARTHTKEFRTLEDTAAEKVTLLRYLPRRGVAILNADDPHVRRMAVGCRAKVAFFGQSAECDYRGESAESRWPGRLQFRLHTSDADRLVATQFVGTHWLGSVLAALAGAHACGVPILEAVRRVGEVKPFMGRMQPVALPNGAIFMRDEENGSPDTLDAMFKVLQESTARRRGLVFSDVSDSKERPRTRLRKIGRTAAEHCDFAVFVGVHGAHAVQAAVSAGMDPTSAHEFVTVQQAAEGLRGIGWLLENPMYDSTPLRRLFTTRA
jgi:UDP-N-acetylmuramoyl-tripeptide--D-alanyl-D-alanine ligase